MRGSSEYSDSREPRYRRDRSRDRTNDDRRYQRDYEERRYQGPFGERTRRDDYDSKYRRRDSYDSRKKEYNRRDSDDSRNKYHKRDFDEPRRRSRDARSRSPNRRSRAALPSQDASFRKDLDLPPGEAQPPKEKPNYKPTGLLAKEANTVAGTTTVLKYHEPNEARKPPPSQQWRIYVFKDKDLVDTIKLYERSCWLVGRDQNVTDLLLEHSSISKQHAVIQFRYSSTVNEYGDKIDKVKPYVIDLDSMRGTKLNEKRIEASRYVELVDGDVMTFGGSEQEYVVMLPTPEKRKK